MDPLSLPLLSSFPLYAFALNNHHFLCATEIKQPPKRNGPSLKIATSTKLILSTNDPKLGVGASVIPWAGFKVDHWQVTGIKTNIPIPVYTINNLLIICNLHDDLRYYSCQHIMYVFHTSSQNKRGNSHSCPSTIVPHVFTNTKQTWVIYRFYGGGLAVKYLFSYWSQN